MCTNFIPTPKNLYRASLKWSEPTFDYKVETYVTYRAPIRLLARDTREPELREASFGLIPFWAKDGKIARKTYNARAETVAERPSYRDSWRKGRLALVPLVGFFEPNYESGRPIRWRIGRVDEEPFTVAAIWDFWRGADGAESTTSFSMLTINADGHPLMARFHAPGDEKRSLVIIPPDLRDRWLTSSASEAIEFLKPMAADEFTAWPDPAPPRKRVGSPRTTKGESEGFMGY